MGMDMEERVRMAKQASIVLASIGTESKNLALQRMADALHVSRKEILHANQEDMSQAQRMVEKGELKSSLVQRLALNDDKITGMIEGILDVKGLEDPVGRTLSAIELDKGLELYQVSCPIGLIGVIFESRPDVIPQIMSLCLKSGNATLFKGGSEAVNSNRTLFRMLVEAVESIPDMPKGAFQLMETREEVSSILSMDQYIDLLVPRGSNQFVSYIQENTKIPVLGHTSGICHAFVDEGSEMEMAVRVVLDSKTQYAAACNSIETLLVHSAIAEDFLPLIGRHFLDAGVEMRCDSRSMNLLASTGLSGSLMEATAEDWSTEYNDRIISVKIVDSVDEAIDHINRYGSHHTDTIITGRPESMRGFQSLVDSSSVMINCSTRFADGYRYGKGAEIGISTHKVHSRGPVGMEGLLIYKYVLVGSGQVVADYSGRGAKNFTHRRLGRELPSGEKNE